MNLVSDDAFKSTQWNSVAGIFLFLWLVFLGNESSCASGTKKANPACEKYCVMKMFYPKTLPWSHSRNANIIIIGSRFSFRDVELLIT
jgi:hypothetical protein